MVALIRQIVDLGVAVVTRRDAVTSLGGQDLVSLAFSIGAALFRVSGLEEPASTTAAVIIRAIRVHFDEILFTHHGFDHVAQILGNRVPKGFPHQLTRVLYRKFDLAFPVPLGTDLEFAIANPFGVVLNDALDFEVEIYLEFFQSGPDCEKFVPSLGIEPDRAPEILHRFCFYTHDFFPVFVVGHEHTIVFGRPALGPVSPISPDKIEDFP